MSVSLQFCNVMQESFQLGKEELLLKEADQSGSG